MNCVRRLNRPVLVFHGDGVASKRQSTIRLKIEGNSIANKVKGRTGGRSRLKGTCKGQMGLPTNSVTKKDETQVAHVYGQETSADGRVRGVFRMGNGNGKPYKDTGSQ